jgi:N-acetyl-anhydromuramyl-L-alanine amidase AmpD
MLGRSSILCIGLSILAGCGSHDEPKPQIVRSPASSEPVVVQPKKRVVKGTPYDQPVDRNIPSDWLPPPGEERRWKAIVLHHSGTNNGNAAIFDRWHREGNHWEGVGYDFVIGNGTDSGDGQVEVTFRWRQQRTGAHCKTPTNWANESAVGICLVGNFNHTAPTSRQMQSLLRLIRFLQKRYDISRRQVYGHNTTPGARATDCPGSKFPMARLKSMLGA